MNKIKISLAAKEVLQEEVVLKQQLEYAFKRIKQLEQENKQLKEQTKNLSRASKKQRQRYKSNLGQLKQIKGRYLAMRAQLQQKVQKYVATSGKFDSWGVYKYYRASAQSAANRIDRAHPGFFEAVDDLPHEGILDLIWKNYCTYHTSEDFYNEHGEQYVDENGYHQLCLEIAAKYDREILV